MFTAAFAVPYFLLLDTGIPAVVWIALLVAGGVGLAPMIAVQPAFYAELFGPRVRYTGFAFSRELGAALAGPSAFVGAALLTPLGGRPWLVAAYMIVTAGVSLAAFVYASENRGLDMSAEDTQQRELVGAR